MQDLLENDYKNNAMYNMDTQKTVDKKNRDFKGWYSEKLITNYCRR